MDKIYRRRRKTSDNDKAPRDGKIKYYYLASKAL